MNRTLIQSLILQKINESIYLVEDRIPSLITKWKGMREIPDPLEAHEIVAGIKPTLKIVPKLNAEHDREMTRHISGTFDKQAQTIESIRTSRERGEISDKEFISRNSSYNKGGEEYTKAIVEKISKADPSPGKEYTDKMLQWYSQSSERTPHYNHNWNIAPNSISDPYRRSMRHEIRNALARKQQQQGFIGDRPPSIDDVSHEMVDKAFKIHFQQRDARTKHLDELRHSTDNPFRMEDLGRATDALQLYHKVKHLLPAEHRDINKIHSLHHLEEVVEPYRHHVSPSDLEKLHKSNMIYDDEHVTAYHVPNQEASCSLGAGTRWCVSGRTDNYFKSYNESSPLIMFVDKKKKMNPYLRNPENKQNYKRYMFHFGHHRSDAMSESTGHQLMDEADQPVEYKDFIRQFPQLKHIPQLQHLHPVLFQSETIDQKKDKLQTASGLKEIMDHMQKYPQFHRKEHQASNIIAHLPIR